MCEVFVAFSFCGVQAKLGAVLKAIKNVKDAWPFARAVNPKLVPDYYNVIKEPMDLETMTKKLNAGSYTTKVSFFNKRDSCCSLVTCFFRVSGTLRL